MQYSEPMVTISLREYSDLKTKKEEQVEVEIHSRIVSYLSTFLGRTAQATKTEASIILEAFNKDERIPFTLNIQNNKLVAFKKSNWTPPL